jgi:putative aldouronate transport system permease protein
MTQPKIQRACIAQNIVMIIFSVLSLFPFVVLISSSFTDENVLIRSGYSMFPQKFSLEAYNYLWAQGETLVRAYGITIFVTVLGTVAGLIMTAMLAYPLSRKNLPKRGIFAFFVFFSMLFNGGLVPTYFLYARFLGLKNTIWALIIPGLLVNAFNVILMRTFFTLNIPTSLIESADIDGANEIQIFGKIVLPMSLPIMASIGLFIGIAYWNDWYNGLIYLTDQNLFSIQVVLNRIISDAQFLTSSNLGSTVSSQALKTPTTSVRMAIAVIAVIPIMVSYPFFQKYFVKGMTIGAVKG